MAKISILQQGRIVSTTATATMTNEMRLISIFS